MKSRRNRIANTTATKTMSALGNHAFYSTSVDSEKGKILKKSMATLSLPSHLKLICIKGQIQQRPKSASNGRGQRFRGDKGCGWGLQAE
jgi:hypothetical protein